MWCLLYLDTIVVSTWRLGAPFGVVCYARSSESLIFLNSTGVGCALHHFGMVCKGPGSCLEVAPSGGCGGCGGCGGGVGGVWMIGGRGMHTGNSCEVLARAATDGPTCTEA